MIAKELEDRGIAINPMLMAALMLSEMMARYILTFFCSPNTSRLAQFTKIWAVDARSERNPARQRTKEKQQMYFRTITALENCKKQKIVYRMRMMLVMYTLIQVVDLQLMLFSSFITPNYLVEELQMVVTLPRQVMKLRTAMVISPLEMQKWLKVRQQLIGARMNPRTSLESVIADCSLFSFLSIRQYLRMSQTQMKTVGMTVLMMAIMVYYWGERKVKRKRNRDGKGKVILKMMRRGWEQGQREYPVRVEKRVVKKDLSFQELRMGATLSSVSILNSIILLTGGYEQLSQRIYTIHQGSQSPFDLFPLDNQMGVLLESNPNPPSIRGNSHVPLNHLSLPNIPATSPPLSSPIFQYLFYSLLSAYHSPHPSTSKQYQIINPLMQTLNNSFSFNESIDTASQSSPKFNKELSLYEETLIAQSTLTLEEYFIKYPIHSSKYSVIQLDAGDLPINRELKSLYNTGVCLNNSPTLYEILLVGLLYHFYCNKNSNKKLSEWKVFLYGEESKKYVTEIIGENRKQKDVHLQVDDRSYDQFKGCLAKAFRVIESQTRSKSPYFSYLALMDLLNSNDIILVYLAIALRVLVQKMSEEYLMDLQKDSTRNINGEPEIDILDIIVEYFGIGINLLHVEEGFLREESFQGENKVGAMDIVVNENENSNLFKYVYLVSVRVQESRDIRVIVEEERMEVGQERGEGESYRYQLEEGRAGEGEGGTLGTQEVREFERIEQGEKEEQLPRQQLPVQIGDFKLKQNTHSNSFKEEVPLPHPTNSRLTPQSPEQTLNPISTPSKPNQIMHPDEIPPPFESSQVQTPEPPATPPHEEQIHQTNESPTNEDQDLDASTPNRRQPKGFEIKRLQMKQIREFPPSDEQPNQKTKRKTRKVRNPNMNPRKLKEVFQETMRRIKQESEHVFEKGEFLIEKVESMTKEERIKWNRLTLEKLGDVKIEGRGGES